MLTRISLEPAQRFLSAPGCSVGFVFESVFDVDAGASEAECDVSGDR